MSKRGDKILKLAPKLEKKLKPYCKRLKVVGSIIRGDKNPVDIDIILIPKDREKLETYMKKFGKYKQGGEKRSSWRIEGIQVELYYTIAEEWGAAHLAYSTETGASIGLRVVAKKKGFKLSQHGLFKGTKRIAGRTERDIYKKLGRPYKAPKDR